jgi:hypothetical protein
VSLAGGCTDEAFGLVRDYVEPLANVASIRALAFIAWSKPTWPSFASGCDVRVLYILSFLQDLP